MRHAVYCLFLLVALGLLTAAQANDDAHLLLSVPGVTGSFVGGQYSGWIEGANLLHHVPDLPEGADLLQVAQMTPQENVFTYPEGEGISFTKELDKASARLAEACRAGRGFAAIKLALCTVRDGRMKTVLTLNFEEIKIASYQVFAPGFGDRNTLVPIAEENPLEVLVLLPRSVRWKLALM